MNKRAQNLHFDTSGFSKALEKFRKLSKRDFETVLREQARGVVRHVIALTPPSQGKANGEAKKRGEATIAADLARILSPGNQAFIDRFVEFNGGTEAKELFGHKGAAALGFVYTKVLQKGDLTTWHDSRRRGDGRVKQVNKGVTTGLKKKDLRGLDVGLVESKTYAWFRKRVQARVGLLAGGWNRAAERLGYNPPAWIRRHGAERGGIDISLAGEKMRIVISNQVKFAGNVKGLERRVQKAINLQTRAMLRRVEFAEKKAAKRAGFRTR